MDAIAPQWWRGPLDKTGGASARKTHSRAAGHAHEDTGARGTGPLHTDGRLLVPARDVGGVNRSRERLLDFKS